MKKLTKTLIGGTILLSGIGAAVAIAKKATKSGVDDDYFEFDDDDDFFDEDYDGDVKDTEE